MRSEKGQALPLAILALTIGTLVIAPFLGHVSSSIIGSRVYGSIIGVREAADSGVEHAIWGLTYGTLAELFTDTGDTITYQLGEAINDVIPTVTVTASDIGDGEGGSGVNGVIDTLEFDYYSDTPRIIQVSDTVLAIVYHASGNKGYLKTVSVDASGNIGDTVIDTLNFENNNCYEPDITQVSGIIYAIVYRSSGSRGVIVSVSIDSNGNIGNRTIDSLTFENSTCYEPGIVRVTSTIYAIAYRGSSNRGYLKTVSISSGGSIGNSAISTLNFDNYAGYEPEIISVSGTTYAIAYRGFFNRGYLTTVSISASGIISGFTIDTLTFDYWAGYEPEIVSVSGTTYAIAYRGFFNRGYLASVSILANGDIGNYVINSFIFDNTAAYTPSITVASGNVFAIAYSNGSTSGYFGTVSITEDGTITSTEMDTLNFEINTCYGTNLQPVSSSIFAIAYRGQYNSGYLKTVGMSAGTTESLYQIVSAAGDVTITAYVSTSNNTASIISWQIQ